MRSFAITCGKALYERKRLSKKFKECRSRLLEPGKNGRNDWRLELNSTNRRLQFQKRSQYLIRTHNETLSVIAMRVHNPDRSPVGVNRCDIAPTPTSFLEIVGDYFPVYVATLEYG